MLEIIYNPKFTVAAKGNAVAGLILNELDRSTPILKQNGGYIQRGDAEWIAMLGVSEADFRNAIATILALSVKLDGELVPVLKIKYVGHPIQIRYYINEAALENL